MKVWVMVGREWDDANVWGVFYTPEAAQRSPGLPSDLEWKFRESLQQWEAHSQRLHMSYTITDYKVQA